MVVRELVTRIRFLLDKAGIKSAENTTSQVKKSLSDAGNAGEQAGAKISKGMGQAAKAANEAKTAMDASSKAAKSVGASFRSGKGLTFISTSQATSAMASLGASGVQAGAKISEGMKTAAKSVAEVTAAIDKSSNSAKKVAASFRGGRGLKFISKGQAPILGNSLGPAIDNAKKAGFSLKELSPIGSMVTGVYMGVGQAIMSAMASAINSTIEAGTRLQQLDGRLRSVTKSDAERRALEDKLFTVADNSRSDIDSVGDLYFKVARASDQTGLGEQENLDLTETVGKALTVGGADTAQKNATILQLSQALGSGVLQGDELRSLNENASGLMTEIAKYFNTTVGGLKEMGKQGELTSKEVAKAILFAKKRIDEQYEKMPMTISDSMTRIKNTFKKGLLEVEASTGILNGLAIAIYKPFQKLEQGFSWLAQKAGGSANLMRIMTVALMALGAAIAYVNFSKIVSGIQTIATALRAFAVANGVAMWQLLLIAAAIALVALVLEDLYTWVNGGESVTGDLLGSFEDFKNANPWIQALITSFQELGTMIAKTWEQMKEGLANIDFSAVMPALTALGQVLLPGISAAFELIGAVIIGVIRLVVWLITQMFEFLNSGNIVAETIKEIFQTMVDYIVDLIKFWTAVFKGDWEGAIQAGIDAFSNLFNHVLSILQRIAGAIRKYVTDKLAEAKSAVLGFLGWSSEQTSGAIQNSSNASITISQNINGATVTTTDVAYEGFGGVEFAD